MLVAPDGVPVAFSVISGDVVLGSREQSSAIAPPVKQCDIRFERAAIRMDRGIVEVATKYCFWRFRRTHAQWSGTQPAIAVFTRHKRSTKQAASMFSSDDATSNRWPLGKIPNNPKHLMIFTVPQPKLSNHSIPNFMQTDTFLLFCPFYFFFVKLLQRHLTIL